MSKDNGSQFIGAHSKNRPSNAFEDMFNNLQAESYEEELKRKKAEQRQREAGTNKHGFADLSSTHKTGNGY